MDAAPPAGENPLQPVEQPTEETLRVRRTHSTEVIIQLLKNLPFISVLQRNKEIEAQNAARSLKRLNHAADPVNYPDNGSEAASLITIDPKDPARLKIPSFFMTVREHIYPSLARWLADEEIFDKDLKRKAGDEIRV